MAKVRNRFRVLLAQKEMRDGRNYTYDDIAAATGLSKTTITAYVNGRVSRFDESTLIAVCTWLDCSLAELIEYPPVMSQQSIPAIALAG